MDDEETATGQDPGRVGGMQTVDRAIDILIAVADGPVLLPQLADRVGLPTATCYRIAQSLAKRGLLVATARSGYRLGPLLKELAPRG